MACSGSADSSVHAQQLLGDVVNFFRISQRSLCKLSRGARQCATNTDRHSTAQAVSMRSAAIFMGLYVIAQTSSTCSAADNTHVDNKSKFTILVTTSYPGGNSQFTERPITPGDSGISAP